MLHRRSPSVAAALPGATALALALLASRAHAANPITVRPPADPLCAASTGTCTPPPYVAIMSAFPAELEPTIAKAAVDETVVVDGRTYYLGTLGGVRVVMVLSGIGLVNAAATTQALLDRFEVAAIVFSGVAGSRQNIADVAVPAHWSDGAATYDADATLLAAAQRVAAAPPLLEQCTFHPPEPPGPMVCLDRTPQIVVGGDGASEDPFGGQAATCQPNGGPIFGCEVRPPASAAATEPGAHAAVDASELDAQDMETAAMARVATAAGVPFVAFRGVSDGPGDPLDLGGFPNQFFTYYQIAADNASAAMAALLGQITAPKADAYGRRRATLAPNRSIGSACDWERAAGAACANNLSPRVVTAAVTRACAAVADAADATLPARAQRRAAHQARLAFKLAARHLKRDRLPGVTDACKQLLLPALAARGTPSS